ncbi:MAG: pyrophosphatase PpaX [Streblomastix strix]|uniref:Pyrophosphatase PpaX n=1 Tax=Streblomastix strix TaxID=222440 RepID=A0A5J4V1S1_9EUKA|nr:MAG: pyrophosphatase PpaX [Streblomastix strix]
MTSLNSKNIEDQRYDAVLFDLDGTLSDSLPVILESRQRLLDNHGIQKSKEQIADERKSVLFYEELCINFDKKLSEQEYKDLSKEYFEIQENLIGQYVRLFPGVLQVLQELKRQEIPMGIITIRNQESTNKFVHYLKIKEFFTIIVAPDGFAHPKPHPDQVNFALEQMGLRGEKWTQSRDARILYVGDALIDVETAEQAKCDCAIVPYASFAIDDEVKSRIKYLPTRVEDLLQIALHRTQ